MKQRILNKLVQVIIASVLAIIITACNNTAETVDSSDVSKSYLIVEEAFTKALEIPENLEGFDATINMKCQMQRLDSYRVRIVILICK
jgi:uncharacterized lipoprotein YehR (DUF1307 family)